MFLSADIEQLGNMLLDRIKVFCFNHDPKYSFAFGYKPKFPINGWEVYNDEKEWQRLGISLEDEVNTYTTIRNVH